MTKDKDEEPFVNSEPYEDVIYKMQLLDELSNIGVKVFKWNCDTWKYQYNDVPEWQIETLLYQNGICTVFKDHVTGEYYVLPVAVENIEYSAYGLPSRWRVSAMGIQGGRFNSYVFDKSNAVLIWNNARRTPTFPLVNTCVDMMVKVRRNIINNLMCVRSQIVWKLEDEKALSGKLLQKQRDDGVLNIIVKTVENGRDPQCEVQNLGVEYLGDRLPDLFNFFKNQVYAHLGVDSVQVDKKERALTDEINANNDSTALIRNSRFDQRLRAVDQMIDLWPDLDVSVEINQDLLRRDALIPDYTYNKTQGSE